MFPIQVTILTMLLGGYGKEWLKTGEVPVSPGNLGNFEMTIIMIV